MRYRRLLKGLPPLYQQPVHMFWFTASMKRETSVGASGDRNEVDPSKKVITVYTKYGS